MNDRTGSLRLIMPVPDSMSKMSDIAQSISNGSLVIDCRFLCTYSLGDVTSIGLDAMSHPIVSCLQD